MIEEGNPHLLIENENSFFRKLINELGEEFSIPLIDQAKFSFESKKSSKKKQKHESVDIWGEFIENQIVFDD